MTEAAPTPDGNETAKRRQAAVTAAHAKLRAQYPTEYEALLKAEYEARGLTYVAKVSPEERAKAADAEKKAKAIEKASALLADAGLTPDVLLAPASELPGADAPTA